MLTKKLKLYPVMSMRKMEIVPGLMVPGRNRLAGGLPAVDPMIGRAETSEVAAGRCVNVRSGDGGGIEAVGTSETIAECMHQPVMTDRRDDVRYFFTLDAECNLHVELMETTQGETVQTDEFLATLPAPIAQYAPCGEFLVLRLTDNSLFYLLWHADRLCYSALGTLPGLGEITVATVAQPDAVATVANTKFSSAIDDPRQVSLPTVAASAVEAVREAFQQASRRAAEAGNWTQPVRVRMVWRLWDGSILHISAPQTLEGITTQNGGRVCLAMTAADGKGYTGTARGSLSLPAYRISVAIPDAMPEQWRDVVRTIEIWTSTEPDVLTGEAGVALIEGPGTAPQIGVTLIRKSDPTVEAILENSMLERNRVLDSAVGNTVVDLIRDSAPKKLLDPQDVAPSFPSEAEVLSGSGDWLYVSSPRGVETSKRGNPFVVAGSSVCAGGKVREIRPQPFGGGAYTRQYVYLFTDRGISALIHDDTGRHRNLRMISQAVVGPRAASCPLSDSVAAIDEQGILLRLTDAKVKVLARGFKAYDSIAFERRFNELCLFSSASDQWLALSLDSKALLASYRDLPRSSVPVDCAGSLYLLENNKIILLESEQTPKAPISWESKSAAWPVGGAVRISANVSDPDADLYLHVRTRGFFSHPLFPHPIPICRISICGPTQGFNGAGALLPLPGKSALSLEAAGKAARVAAFRVEMPD